MARAINPTGGQATRATQDGTNDVAIDAADKPPAPPGMERLKFDAMK